MASFSSSTTAIITFYAFISFFLFFAFTFSEGQSGAAVDYRGGKSTRRFCNDKNTADFRGFAKSQNFLKLNGISTCQPRSSWPLTPPVDELRQDPSDQEVRKRKLEALATSQANKKKTSEASDGEVSPAKNVPPVRYAAIPSSLMNTPNMSTSNPPRESPASQQPLSDWPESSLLVAARSHALMTVTYLTEVTRRCEEFSKAKAELEAKVSSLEESLRGERAKVKSLEDSLVHQSKQMANREEAFIALTADQAKMKKSLEGVTSKIVCQVKRAFQVEVNQF